jgi:hypothetical protein
MEQMMSREAKHAKETAEQRRRVQADVDVIDRKSKVIEIDETADANLCHGRDTADYRRVGGESGKRGSSAEV